jgi:hypothetical protein
VPEPSSLVLVASGMVTLALSRKNAARMRRDV